MNNYKHLKKKKTLIQFSDGSSCYLSLYINKKELLVESDFKSKFIWKNKPNSFDTDSFRNDMLHSYNKLFIKTK